jgi:hypothetical protein
MYVRDMNRNGKKIARYARYYMPFTSFDFFSALVLTLFNIIRTGNRIIMAVLL